MIKIERDNIEEDYGSIAAEYFDELKKYMKKSTAERPFLYNFLISSGELRFDILFCKPEKFKGIIEDFHDRHKTEIQKYKEIEKRIKTATNKVDKENFEKELKTTEYYKFCKYMNDRYEYFIDKNGSWLSKELKVDTCPYCNRQYTFTVNSKKKTRPQFDHFYPKSKYPYLALSFYNLVPCCPVCNHIKGEDEIDFHPYIKGFGNDFQFSVNYWDYIFRNDEVKVLLKNKKNKKTRNRNIEIFALNELYTQHKDYVQEIIDKAHAYNDDYYNGIIETFSAIGKSSSEINCLIFGNYIDTVDHEKRPLSKLTKDILEQIGLM